MYNTRITAIQSPFTLAQFTYYKRSTKETANFPLDSWKYSTKETINNATGIVIVA